MVRTVFLFLLGISIQPLCNPAAAGELPKRALCEKGTQLEMNHCEDERFKAADAEMNRLYKAQLARMDPQFKDAIARFRAAQRAWLAFRDRVCAYEVGPAEEGGSSWSASLSICLTYRTELRIRDLEQYLSCDSGNCPYTD